VIDPSGTAFQTLDLVPLIGDHPGVVYAKCCHFSFYLRFLSRLNLQFSRDQRTDQPYNRRRHRMISGRTAPFRQAGKTLTGRDAGVHPVHVDARHCRPGAVGKLDHKHLSAMSPADPAPRVLVFVDDWQLLAILPVSVFECLLAGHR
jgi:hypothetical protein